MEFLPSIKARLARVPPFVKLLVLIGIVSLVAIFAFNVAAGTVTSYAIFALLCGSHLFMHGSHGSHQHPDQGSSDPSSRTQPYKASAEDHTDHSTGCH